MSEPTIDVLAVDQIGMGANFNPQPSTIESPLDEKSTMGANGDIACSKTTGDIENVTQSFTYCGSDFLTDIGTLLSKFGDVQSGGYIVTSLGINMTAADYATVDITGHNHTTNPHVAGIPVGYADVSGALPAGIGESFENWNGQDVPDFEITLGTDATPASATITFSFGAHPEDFNPDGSHFKGKNITPRADLDMEFSGIPTSNTKSAIETDLSAPVGTPTWKVTNDPLTQSNEAFDRFSFTAYATFELATA